MAFLLECVPGISSPNLYPSGTTLDFENKKVIVSTVNAEKIPFFFKLVLIASDNEKSCAVPV